VGGERRMPQSPQQEVMRSHFLRGVNVRARFASYVGATKWQLVVQLPPWWLGTSAPRA
jgi:hypothetical protein